MPGKLYMIIEHFKDSAISGMRPDAPEGLKYLSRWVEEGLGRCFQLMETDERTLLDEWLGELERPHGF